MSEAVEHLTPTEAGLYYDVPFEDYLRWDFCSQSLLTVIRDKSPLHALAEMKNPSPSTRAQVVGDAIHRAILQPDLFEEEFLCGPDGPWNRNPWKSELDEMRAAYPGVTILKPEEYDTCLRARDAVRGHPIAGPLLTDEVEVSAVWQDPATGVWCKGRFDCINREHKALVDLKKTRDASRREFMRAIGNYGYYLQAAMYTSGADVLGLDIDHFIFIAIEETPPAVAVYRIHDEALIAAGHELYELMKTYKECRESGVWPGYPDDIQDISVPYWVISNIEERTGVELT